MIGIPSGVATPHVHWLFVKVLYYRVPTGPPFVSNARQKPYETLAHFCTEARRQYDPLVAALLASAFCAHLTAPISEVESVWVESEAGVLIHSPGPHKE
jgi:hypothetical protein